jgi:hypothetical protein
VEEKKKEEKPKKKEDKKKESKKEIADDGTACLDCQTILAEEARYCISCGLQQPTAQKFKSKSRKAPTNDDVKIEELLDDADAKLDELAEKKAAGGESAGGGGGGASAEELEKAKAEITKWKGLFTAAAADVDEKDEIIASQMEQIDELQAELEENQ